MHQLRIVFTCLCAYLPRENDVLVVIPDGREGHSHADDSGHPGHSGSQTVTVPPHVAVIEFDPSDLSPQSEIQPHLLFRHPDAHRDLGMVFLTGQDISLDPAPSGAPVLRGGRVADHRTPQSPAEMEDFTWIAEVASLDTGASTMDEPCATPGTSAGGRVVARMSLQGGTIGAKLVALDGQTHEPLRFRFVDATAPASIHPTYSQALAGAVEYDLTVFSEEVTLLLKSFGGTTHRLTFSFAGRPTGSTLEILIKNMPLESVLELTDTIRPDVQPDVDKHFAMYYTLSKTRPQTPWIPFGTQARVGGPICPGVRFAK